MYLHLIYKQIFFYINMNKFVRTNVRALHRNISLYLKIGNIG